MSIITDHHGKIAMVIGAGGFIGHNLVKRLKKEGWYVVGVDKHEPRFEKSPADEFRILDAAENRVFIDRYYDRIYQLGANMGGAEFVFTGKNDSEILMNSVAINMNVLEQVHKKFGVGKIFYSSSVCCYPANVEGKESDAYPANPPSNYGWEKIYSERLFQASAKNHGTNIRIARFHNCFGPNGTFDGGREKFPAAICRKVALVKNGGELVVIGDGNQRRPFIFIEDLLDGIEALMSTDDFQGPVNLGPDNSKTVTINQVVDMLREISGKSFTVKHDLSGPTGETDRHANNDLALYELDWEPKCDIRESFGLTYHWIVQQLAHKTTM